MASPELTEAIGNVSGSPVPAMSTNFKVVKVRKPDGTITTVKRRILTPTHEDVSKKSATTSKPDSTTPVSVEKPAETVTAGSEPSITGAGVVKSDKPLKPSSTKVNRKAQKVPAAQTKSSTKTSKKRHSLAPQFIGTVLRKITTIWSTNDFDDIGTNTDDSSDSSDSDNDSRPSSNQDNAQARTNEIHGVGRMVRDSSQILRHNAPTSEDDREKPGTQGDKQAVHDASQPFNTQPQRKRGRRLRKRTILTQFGIGLFTIGTPLLFILLGILAVRLNGKKDDTPSGWRIQEAIKVGVSFWPIVFALVISQSLKAFASYQLERGIRIMTLEQLISSHSVGTVIRQPFVLQKVDIISFGLLCLWSLSPLASQAMQRMSYQISGNNTQSITAYYLDTTGPSLSFNAGATFTGANTSGTTDSAGDIPYSAFLDALYSAAFLPPSPSVLGYEDLFDGWGNTRIPLLTALGSEEYTTWQNVPENLGLEEFSSLYGIPVVQSQPPGGGSTSDVESSYWEFTMDSAYWSFTCSTPVQKSSADVYDSNKSLTQSLGGTLNLGMDFTTASDGSFLGQLYFGSAIIGINGTFDAAQGNDDVPLAYSECNFTQTFVQTFVSCGTNLTYCQPYQMRLAPSPPATIMPTTFTDWLTFASEDTPSLTERYIWNPDPTAEDELDPDKGFTLLEIQGDVFTRRLAMVINTFWNLGFAPMYITGGLPQTNNLGVKTLSASATGGIYSNIWAYSPAWTGVLFVCSIILILFGIFNVIWESRTIGPNVLGFASSIIHNSRYIDAPKISSAMSGPEKARLLGDVRVMMQDVRADDEVGKIALGSVSEGAQRLKPGRLYK